MRADVADVPMCQPRHPAIHTGRLLKARSHDSLPQAYTQPAKHTFQRSRLCSEPILALERKGIIQCDSMSIEEAWSRFGIRVPKEEGDMTPSPSERQCISPLKKSALTDKRVGSFSIPKEVSHIKTASKSRCVSQPYSDSTSLFAEQTLLGKKAVGRGIKTVLQAYRLPNRPYEASLRPSTLAEQPVMISTSASRKAASRVGSLNFISKSKLGIQQIPCVSVSLASAKAKGTNKKMVLQQVAQNRVEVESQLGRPTDCSDSPYSIAKPTVNRVLNLTQTAIPKCAIMQRRSPLTIPKALIGTPTPMFLLKNEDEVIHFDQCYKSDYSTNISDSADSDSVYSCATFSECSSSASTSSISAQSQSDEAKQLWRDLESMLKGELQYVIAASSKDKTTKVQASRIPRLQHGRIFERERPAWRESMAARPSRIPVPSRLLTDSNVCKLGRKDSLMSQTIALLRSTMKNSPSRNDSICRTSSISYACLLPSRERKRREKALEQRNWGEKSLQVY